MHCHLMPGVDDGSKSPEMTAKMLEIAADDGIGGIVCTPHFEAGMKPELLEKRKRSLALTRGLAETICPKMKIFYGNEIFYGDSTLKALESGTAKPLNGTDYILVEFPVYSEFAYIEKAIRTLTYAGYRPVIAHIERYEGMKKMNQVQELVRCGAVMQVNASTVTGAMGWGVKRYVLKLMKYGLVDILGTDAHGIQRRRPEMSEALLLIDKKIGPDYRKLITEINPRLILKGDSLSGKA